MLFWFRNQESRIQSVFLCGVLMKMLKRKSLKLEFFIPPVREHRRLFINTREIIISLIISELS